MEETALCVRRENTHHQVEVQEQQKDDTHEQHAGPKVGSNANMLETAP